MTSFKLAIEYGADGIECDIRLTRDNQLIIHHDPVIFSKGRIYWIHRTNYDDIIKLNGDQDNVPLLSEVSKIVPKDKIFFIEVKSYRQIAELGDQLNKITKDHPNYYVMSFFESVQKYLVDTPIQNGLNYIFPIRNQLERARKYDTKMISPLYWFLRKNTIAKFQKKGMKVIPWTINKSRFLSKFIGYKPDAIFTNELVSALDLRNSIQS